MIYGVLAPSQVVQDFWTINSITSNLQRVSSSIVSWLLFHSHCSLCNPEKTCPVTSRFKILPSASYHEAETSEDPTSNPGGTSGLTACHSPFGKSVAWVNPQPKNVLGFWKKKKVQENTSAAQIGGKESIVLISALSFCSLKCPK